MKCRSDRFLTVHFFSPMVSIAPPGMRHGVPILMYHGISEAFKEGVHPYFEVSTTPTTFAQHMRYLFEHGYRVISLEEVVRFFTQLQEVPAAGHGDRIDGAGSLLSDASSRPVVITFDDGFRDFATEAFPVLSRFGFAATVFLPTAFISDRRRSFLGRECLTWAEVRELRDAGISFSSHTVNHPSLRHVGEAGLRSELLLSKQHIEQHLGESCEGFAYPYAFPETDSRFVTGLRKLMAGAGYHYGVTTSIGLSNTKSDLFFLRRIPINEFDDLKLFSAKLAGGYDWVHAFQVIGKFGKSILRNRLPAFVKSPR